MINGVDDSKQVSMKKLKICSIKTQKILKNLSINIKVQLESIKIQNSLQKIHCKIFIKKIKY